MARERNLEDGEQQIIRRGQRPESGWHNRTVIQMEEEGEQWLISALPRKRPSGGSGGGTAPEPPPTPDPPPNPETDGVQGYCRVWMLANGKSGGSLDVDHIHTPHPSATLYTVSTATALRTALLASGRRFIRVTGSGLLEFNDANFSISDGSYTVDFSAYTGGGMKGYKMVDKSAGDCIWTQGKAAPGEGSAPSQSLDRRGLSFNPGNDPGDEMHGVCLDHMSVAVGPDVVGSMINNVEDSTIQYSLLGPALYQSNIPEQGGVKGYGWNVTTPGNSNPASFYCKRLTFYRNLYAFNKQRNLKHEHGLGMDGVNCVVYNYGNKAPIMGNPRAANYIGCMFKKGPQTTIGNKAFSQQDPGGQNGYPQYADSVYHSGNIGITAAGGSFTLDWSEIQAFALRSTPYDGGPTDADHGALSVAAADLTLFAEVVENAGRTYQDAIDAEIKDHVTNGTSDGFYNGAAFPAPHYSWT